MATRQKNLTDSVAETIAGYFNTVQTLRITSTSNGIPAAANLGAGTYRIRPTVDCYYLQINTGTTVTTLNAFFLPGGLDEDLPVVKTHGPINIVAITGGESGYLYIARRLRQ
jgi:hypothetical protein